MKFKNGLSGLASLLLVAVLVTGCKDSVPTEPQADGTPSLTAAPKRATPITAVTDITSPTPGFPNVLNPECVTIDTETGTAHFEGCIIVGTVTGDLVGAATIVLSAQQDLATGIAPKIRGHFTFDVCHADFGCGVFEGPYKGEAALGGQATVIGNGHGTGDFHTLQFRGTMVERGNTEIFDLDGVIF